LLMDWDKMSNLYRGPSIQFEQQTRDLTVTAIDSKITRSGGRQQQKIPGCSFISPAKFSIRAVVG
jgi:hypothetical protein